MLSAWAGLRGSPGAALPWAGTGLLLFASPASRKAVAELVFHSRVLLCGRFWGAHGPRQGAIRAVRRCDGEQSPCKMCGEADTAAPPTAFQDLLALQNGALHSKLCLVPLAPDGHWCLEPRLAFPTRQTGVSSPLLYPSSRSPLAEINHHLFRLPSVYFVGLRTC